MGWSFFSRFRDKKQFVEYLTDSTNYGDSVSLLKHRLVGNHLWHLVRIEATGRKYISLDLISCRKGEFGYKSISEDSGPAYFDCPKTLIQVADAPATAYATEWRKKALEYNEAKSARKSIAPGKVVSFNGVDYVVKSSAGPRRGLIVWDPSDGQDKRMPFNIFKASAIK